MDVVTTGAPARRARPGRSAVRRVDPRVIAALRVLAWLAGAGLLVVVGGSAAAVADGGERNVPIVLLAALAGWLAPLTAIALLLLAVGRHRRSAVLALVVLIGLITWLPPYPHGNGEVPAEAVADGRAVEITVMTQNVLFGRVPPAEVITAVRREQPDVLVLTEMTEEIADGLTRAGLPALLPHSYLAPAPMAAGTGIWSAYPLAAGTAVPGLSFAGLDVRVQSPDGPVRLLGVHPSPPQQRSWAEDLNILRDHLAATAGEGPVVIAGDLNATQYNGPLRRLLGDRFTDAGSTQVWAWQQQTWPVDPGPSARRVATVGGMPGLRTLRGVLEPPAMIRIDHVLAPDSAQVLDVHTVRMAGTDHLGLVAELRLLR